MLVVFQVEVDDDEEMGDDGDDGYTPDIKLKSASDVLDQVDKDTEEVLDFNFVSGSKVDDTVDGLKGEHNGAQGESWGEQTTKKSCKNRTHFFKAFHLFRHRSVGT